MIMPLPSRIFARSELSSLFFKSSKCSPMRPNPIPMKKLLIPLTLVCSLFPAAATHLYFDPFGDATASGGTSYAIGSALANQKNNPANIWNPVNTTSGSPQAPTIFGTNLSYPDMPQSSGNCVLFVPATGIGQGCRLNFNATIPTNAAYFSYLLKITDLSKVSTNPTTNFFAGWSDGSTAQPGSAVLRVGTKILTKATNGGYVLGVGRNNTVSDYVYDTTVHSTNETLFIVGSYEYFGSVTNVNLWINPPTNSFGSNTPPAPTVSAVHFSNTTGDINTNRVQGFVILCQNSNTPSGFIDELRIGTNWADVTGGDPVILSQPINQSKPPGGTATFTVEARGTASLSYQWFKDGSPLTDGGDFSGSTNATLTVNDISSDDLGTYWVYVTNGLGSFVQSSDATLSFLTDPVITSQPQDVTVNFGDTAMFQVGVSGTAPFSYQWHEQGVGDLSDGGNISGSQSNILSISGVAYPDSGIYWVTVSNINGSLDSSNANLTVIDPYITEQPNPVTQPAGTTATFQVAAAGSGSNSFTYQWFKNNNFLFNTGNISGADTSTLNVSDISSSDQASYYATVIGPASTATSSVVTLTVLSPVTIAEQPSPRTVAPGVRAVFAAVAGGSGPFNYQWTHDGSNIPGATNSDYIITNAQPAEEGNYQLIISNSFSTSSSSSVPLIVSTNLNLSQSNLIVIRVGDGAQTLGLTGNSIYLDQYDTNGNYINTITIPDDGTNAMVDIGQDNVNGVNSGSTTGSCITESLDGRFMVIAGYATNLTYTSNLASSLSTNVPRGIGLVESHGIYSMPVADTSSTFDATFWRAGITDGSNNFWGGGGISGTYYFGFSAPPVIIQSNMINMRSMAQYNGNIYCAGAATPNGILEINGLPEVATNATFLFSGSTGTFDLTVSPNGNLIYVTDQRAQTSGGGIQRYDFDTNSSTWGLTYTMQVGGLGSAKQGPRYITADFSGAEPVLYVTSNDNTFDNNRILKVVDTGANPSITTLAFAGVNETFRGIHFGPVPNTVVPRPKLSFTTAGGNIVLSWAGAFTLQSSTNVTSGYTNVTAISPYTNSLNSAPQLFFRLKQ